MRIIGLLLTITGISLAQPVSAPVFSAMVNAASGSASIAPGSIASIYGRSVFPATGQAATIPLPTRASSTEWVLDGVAMELLYWSPLQVNLIIPATARTGVPLVLGQKTYGANGSSLLVTVGNVTLKDQAAGIFTSPNQDCEILAALGPLDDFCPGKPKYTRGIITDSSGRLVTGRNPARLNAPLTLWATGLGKSANNLTTGYVEAIVKPGVVITRVPDYFWYGSQALNVLFAGPAPGIAGVDQINFTVPSDHLSSGEFCAEEHAMDLQLSIYYGSTDSNFVRLPIIVKAGEARCTGLP